METTLTINTSDDGADGTGFVYGESAAISVVNGMLGEIARTDIPVLIVGESGTGKEVYARLVHRLSGAIGGQPRKIDCRVLDTGRIVSEFHEVFQETGQPMAFGSVFLDGIDELDLAAQRVLLSVLSEGEWSQHAKSFRPRLISAATKNMEAEVESGRFRRELYFRINGACLRLPALRERKEDIANLVAYFLNKHSSGVGKKSPIVDTASLDSLREYHWPGNIRELENLTRKIVAVGNVEAALRDLSAVRIPTTKTCEKATTSSLKVAAKAASREREKELILDALQRTRWNRKRAAQQLQISYKSLLYKIKQLEMPEAMMQERGRK